MQALQNCNVNPMTAVNNESMVNQKNGTGYITCILIPVDFAPKRFFELVSRREAAYEI